MTAEEIKNLTEKMVNNNATPEQRLALLKELNASLKDMHQDFSLLKQKKSLKNLRQSVNAS